ncbi:MAG: serine/threonine-protein kinase [Chitinophagaceae bacterium]
MYCNGICRRRNIGCFTKRKGRLSNAETENIVKQISSALAYLHKRQIIHRDIKPSNFKIQPDGTVKMLDFGIAKNKYSPKLTQTGFVVGTVEYISPEQFQQRSEVKSDIWSLAVMTYELITGYLPFEANNPVTLRSEIIKGSFTDPKLLVPEISKSLESFIQKGLRTHTGERISASDTEQLFGIKKQKTSSFQLLKFPRIKKQVFVPGISLIVIAILFLIFRKGDTIDPKPSPPVPEQTTADTKSIMINASGIQNAEIVLDDNTRQPLPYPVKGKEGETVSFTLRADGYQDKKVELEITSRRNSYEFTLDKITH